MKEISIFIQEEKEIKKQGDLFGVFFEDLNHAADGGLYGEMIRNRSFEFSQVDKEGYNSMTAWEVVERGDSSIQVHIESITPVNNKNPHYLVMEVFTSGEGAGVRNEGYNSGVSIKNGTKYAFSCFCRIRGKRGGRFWVRLEDASGTKCYAETCVLVESTQWMRKECVLFSECDDPDARLAIICKEPICLELDFVSLFSEETFCNRKNGLRKDIAEMISDMKPRFMRFPGGCLMHIGSLNSEDRCAMYRWKNTVGEVHERPSKRNIWNYNQTFGLGFYEFFQFCEDIGAEPLPVIAAGYDPHYLRMVPLDEMEEWIDEALDLIEFANGDVHTKWGSIRAKMGHPASFGMKYLGIGNEEVGEEYFERYEIMLNAVKEKYPEIQVINSAGPGSKGSEFEKGWNQARRTDTSFVDEHFYQNPQWFIANAHRYDSYAETPKAFLGEYASMDDTWYNALVEAAFMIGMEKAKGVGLACYAPLLNNIGYTNWTPTLIHYDNHRVFGSASYYVQKLFMNYMGESLLKAEADVELKNNFAEADLSGGCRMYTERAQVQISNMQIIDRENEEVHLIDCFKLSEENKLVELPEIKGKKYTISFQFEKENGGTAGNLCGKYAFRVDFGMRDENNRLHWTIDGWQRLASLGGVLDGKVCDMGLYQFITEKGKIYECRIEVNGAKVETYIDGKLYANHICKPVIPDEIYYSVVNDEDRNIIVKLVNLKKNAQKVNIQGLSGDRKVKIISMFGYDLTDKNSFDEPQKVCPREEVAEWNEKFEYEVPPYALVFLIFSK